MQLKMELSNARIHVRKERSGWQEDVIETDRHRLTVTLVGKIGVRLESREFRLQDGEAILSEPKVLYQCFVTSEQATFVTFDFDKHDFDRWWHRSSGDDAPVMFQELSTIVPETLKRHLGMWTRDFIEDGRASLEDDVYSFLKTYVAEHATFSEDESYDAVFTYIEENIASVIRIEELSRLANQSKYQFIRNFNALTGYTPSQYITRMRLQKAKHLLRYSNLNLLEVSIAVGFSSPAQPNKHFADWVGCKPARFRENKGASGRDDLTGCVCEVGCNGLRHVLERSRQLDDVRQMVKRARRLEIVETICWVIDE